MPTKINNFRNTEQERRLAKLEDDRDSVFAHIATTNEELGKIKTDVNWLKKSYWVVSAASIGAVISGIITLIIYLISR